MGESAYSSASIEGSDGFFQLCRSGDLNGIRAYLDTGGVVSRRDARGNTGIIIASGRGQTDVIKLLLNNGGNLNDYSLSGIFEGKSALSWACSQGRVETVAYLVQEGVDLHKAPTIGVFAGKTALMWAASQGRTEVVKLLLSLGADFDYTSSIGNFKGKSALMWASSQGRVEAVEVLLQAGANVNAVDNDGVSALMWAAGSEAAGDDSHRKGLLESPTKGHVEVIKLLLRYGADVDMRDKDGITAIMFASFHGHLGAVQVLLSAGADADYTNKEGRNALQLARSADHIDIAEVIEVGPTVTFMEVANAKGMRDLSACGWLLSVLRIAVGGTGILSQRSKNPISGHNYYYRTITCGSDSRLRQSGLDGSLWDLLYAVHGSSVSEVVDILMPTPARSGSATEELMEQDGSSPHPSQQHRPGLDQVLNQQGAAVFASKLRARMQLTVLYERFKVALEKESLYSRGMDSTSEKAALNRAQGGIATCGAAADVL